MPLVNTPIWADCVERERVQMWRLCLPYFGVLSSNNDNRDDGLSPCWVSNETARPHPPLGMSQRGIINLGIAALDRGLSLRFYGRFEFPCFDVPLHQVDRLVASSRQLDQVRLAQFPRTSRSG